MYACRLSANGSFKMTGKNNIKELDNRISIFPLFICMVLNSTENPQTIENVENQTLILT